MIDNNSVFLCGYISLNFNHRTIHPFGFTYISYLYPPFVPAFTFPVMFICPTGLADTPIPVLCTFPVIVVCVLYLIRFPFSPVAKTAPISPFGSASISPKIFNAALNLRTIPTQIPVYNSRRLIGNFNRRSLFMIDNIPIYMYFRSISKNICCILPITYLMLSVNLIFQSIESRKFLILRCRLPPLHNLPVLIPCCILCLRERRAVRPFQATVAQLKQAPFFFLRPSFPSSFVK